MGRDVLSEKSFTVVADKAKKAGSATHVGVQRHKEGKGLHELVDPKGFGVIRRSYTWYEPEGKKFKLLRGVAMLEETRLDTTGSMGNNVEIAMRVLPTTYKLLATGEGAVLGRYDVQMITSIFGDVQDDYVLCRSQAELDERIAEQMTLMVPEGNGGDADEDPQYGLFGAAYLTDTSISRYGLKHYDFTISDARGRNHLSAETLVRVFGPEVFEKAAENGFTIDRAKLPSTKHVVTNLQERAHAFFLQVGSSSDVTAFWRNIFGTDHCVIIPTVEHLPYVKAAIVGLTESTLDLQSLPGFLAKRGLPKDEAELIRRAVMHIPIGAQAALPNFGKIPLRGSTFAKKGDLWPIGAGETPEETDVPAKPRVPKKGGGIKWA